MGDAQNQGGRGDGWVGRSGEDYRPQRRDYGERWLERRLHGLYQNVIDEPVPHEMLDIVARIPESAPLTSGSPPAKLEHPARSLMKHWPVRADGEPGLKKSERQQSP